MLTIMLTRSDTPDSKNILISLVLKILNYKRNNNIYKEITIMI